MARILAGFMAIALLGAGVSVLAILKMGDIQKQSQSIQEAYLPLLLKTARLGKTTEAEVAGIRGYLLTGKEKFADDYLSCAGEADKLEQELVDKAVSAEGKALFTKVRELDRRYSDIGGVSAITEELSAGMEETSAAAEEVNASSEEMEAAIEEMAQKAQQGSEAAREISARAAELKKSTASAQLLAQEIYAEAKDNLEQALHQSKAVEQIGVLSDAILQPVLLTCMSIF